MVGSTSRLGGRVFSKPPVGSDEYVANRLAKMLDDRNRGRRDSTRLSKSAVSPAGRPGLDLLHDYYRGEPPLPWCADGWKDSVLPYLRMSRLNVAPLPVDSVVDKIVPLAWSTAVEDDADGDRVADEVAVENDMASQIAETARSMLTFGDGYALLGDVPAGFRYPRVTAEDARYCITRDDPVTGVTTSGLKSVMDEWTGQDSWFLYGFDEHGPWVRQSVKVRGKRTWLGDRGYFEWGGQWCPLHRVRNENGVGEFEKHLSHIDRINDGIFTRIVIAKYQAWRQRGIKGLPDTRTDPVTGEEVEIDYSDAFLADPGSLWRLPDAADIWESTPVDFGPIRLASIDDVKQFCGMTASPIYYMFPGENESAAGANNQAESFGTRVAKRRRVLESFQAKLWSHLFMAIGDKARAEVGRIRTEWAPIQHHSLSDMSTAAASAVSAGLPWAERMTRIYQYRPADLPRLKALRDQDLMYGAVNSGPA